MHCNWIFHSLLQFVALDSCCAKSTLRQLAYCSVAIMPLDLAGLVENSRILNKQHGISGILLFNGEFFFQIIEGDQVALDATVARLLKDTRHKRITVLYNVIIKERDFKDWSLALRVPDFTPQLEARMHDNDFGEYISDPDGLLHHISRRAQLHLTAFEQIM